MVKKIVNKTKSDSERAARTKLIEELFYDFHRSRAQVYLINFVRGILFGAGSVIGGTLVIAVLIWVFSMLATIVPPLDDFFTGVSNTLQTEE